MPPPRGDRSCARSPSAMFASSTQSLGDGWSTWPQWPRLLRALMTSRWLISTTPSRKSTATTNRDPVTDTCGVRGLNALLGIVSTQFSAPIIIGSRLRRGATASPRGAKRFVADTHTTVRRLRSATATGVVLLRADSAFYGHAVISTAHHAGAKVSITARMDWAVKRAIGTIGERCVDDDPIHQRDSR